MRACEAHPTFEEAARFPSPLLKITFLAPEIEPPNDHG